MSSNPILEFGSYLYPVLRPLKTAASYLLRFDIRCGVVYI